MLKIWYTQLCGDILLEYVLFRTVVGWEEHALAHCAASQKVAGSFTEVPLEFFIDIILSAALWLCGNSNVVWRLKATGP